MTKADLVDRIQEMRSCSIAEAVELLDLTLDILKEAIVTEGLVKISGFGSFVVRQKTDRKGRNPQTGEAITISARKILMFKPSLSLKYRVNQG